MFFFSLSTMVPESRQKTGSGLGIKNSIILGPGKQSQIATP